MGNKLYVGNLPYQMRDSDLEQAFSQFGQVTSAKVMMERETGRSKGFGFVEMGSDAEAQAAMKIALALRSDLTIAGKKTPPMRFPERRKIWIDGLRLAGMPEG